MTQFKSNSIRPFIGSKDYILCQNFYRDLGFDVHEVAQALCVCIKDDIAFYLQDAYVEEWINNTMVFIEVRDVEKCYDELFSLNLPEKYDGVRLMPIRRDNWGDECFLIDPSGVLWHFGQFKS